MFDDNPLSVIPTETVAPVAATDDAANDTATVTETPEVKTQAVTEAVETQEQKPEAQDDPAESKDLKTVRDWGRGLERDVKQKFAPAYAGLEKTATALYGTSTPEDILAAAKTVETLAPQIKALTSDTATQMEVVAALKQMLPKENVEAFAWHVLNNPDNHDFIFSDPEVIQVIEQRLLNGRTVAEIEAILANVPEAERDPDKEALRKELADIRADKKRSADAADFEAANKRSADLADRFFEQPTKRILAEDFKLVAPEGASEADKQLFADAAEDIGYVAQARFAKENMAAFMQIDQLYRQGRQVQAQAAEIRLANRYHATLIKTAERHVNLLKSRSAAVVNDQQGKINGVRTEVSGSVDKGQQKEEAWDIDAPDFAQKFAASFHN